MKHKAILTIILLLLTLFHSESTQAQRLVVWQKDGHNVTFDLNERPKTTFTTKDLVITTTATTIKFPLSNVQRYTYEGGALSVKDIKSYGICISYEDENIIVKGLANGKTVTVYSIEGKRLITRCSDGSNNLTISLIKFSAGVYMIKADEITYKFLKR